MPLVAGDLIQPYGRIESDLFSDTLNRVSQWLVEAQGKTTDLDADTAARAQAAWVYFRAFDSKANQMAQAPMDVTVEGNTSRRYIKEQIAEFREMASGYLSEFNTYVEEDEPSGDIQVVTVLGAEWF